ncbi:hypothetical protein M7I_2351 [Glarea lozoyensis 74030]|uniref:Uncharacterized protein n=1 Tax=Glarea lozoyensis (strain ATCC 74030 / MF5533) TaxID=1104152 RepID=H0EIJ2_GLAL7|nr:hypothetical protein M7I_2351 [Glarea lozoyensis 74030]
MAASHARDFSAKQLSWIFIPILLILFVLGAIIFGRYYSRRRRATRQLIAAGVVSQDLEKAAANAHRSISHVPLPAPYYGREHPGSGSDSSSFESIKKKRRIVNESKTNIFNSI